MQKIDWKIDYEPKEVFDRGDIYTLELNGKIIAEFINNGEWGRGIQLADKHGKLHYTYTIYDNLSLQETQKAIEERMQI